MKVEGAVAVFDVAEDAAGADRGELLIITDKPDTRTATDGELHGRIERQGVGHAGLVDDDQRRRPDPRRPIRQVAMVKGPGEFGQSVGTNAGLFSEDVGGGRGRGEAEHLPAVFGPGQGQGAHGRGLPCAGGRDREL